ncbi:MAG: hypothetical protein K9N35_02000 [Candidatus Marinimicrobia bacterium]|nr:hypothetical protein [Candidatus Neomarinimicrobiota bacterium]
MKKSILIISLISMLTSVLIAGDLRVNIVNGTTKSTGHADNITLMDLTTGMTPVSSKTNVDGTITFSDVEAGGQTRYLIQVQYDGVSYTESFVPTLDVNAWEKTVTVYQRSEQVSELKISIPYFAVFASGDQLYIQKRLIIENQSDPPVTYMASPGVVPVHIPEDITQLETLTFKSGSMPLKTAPIDTDKGQMLPNPVKPGISEIDMAYFVPYHSSGTMLSEEMFFDIDHFHVYTMPTSLNIKIDGLVKESEENGWMTYALEHVKSGSMMNFEISGEGISETQAQAQSGQESGGIVIENRLPVSTELFISGVLIMSIMIALFISITQQSADLKQESIDMLKNQRKVLLKKYVEMKASSEDMAAQDKVLHQLYSVYKTLDRIK